MYHIWLMIDCIHAASSIVHGVLVTYDGQPPVSPMAYYMDVTHYTL